MKKINRYLKFEYQPVAVKEEFASWQEMTLEYGEVPAELDGYFLRNSSNPQFLPGNKYHWFDGDGFVQGIRLQKGKAHFMGKFVRTEKFQLEGKKNKSVFGGLRGPINSNDPLRSLVRTGKFVIAGQNPFASTSNTDLVYHNGRLLSLWMLCGPAYELDLETLDTRGVYDFDNGSQRIEHGISAHPTVCPKDGKLFVMDFVESWKRFSKPQICISSVSADGSEIQTKKFPLSGRHLLHDMAVTENHVVLLDMPAEMTPTGMKYQHGKSTRFGVLRTDFGPIHNPKTGKEEGILWFDDPSGCYIIHVVNAYEEDGKIILFALRKPYLKLTKKVEDAPGSVFEGHLHRWEMDLATGEIANEIGESYQEFFPKGSEFPTINSQFQGLKNRYSYLPGVARQNRFNFDSFSKFDHQTKTYECHQYEKGTYVGEVRFAPHPDAKGEEDKGWILAFVHTLKEGETEVSLEIFDAQNLGGGAVARLGLPVHLPIGFHTVWIGANEIKSRDSHQAG